MDLLLLLVIRSRLLASIHFQRRSGSALAASARILLSIRSAKERLDLVDQRGDLHAIGVLSGNFPKLAQVLTGCRCFAFFPPGPEAGQLSA